MRLLFIVTFVLAILYGGYWVVGSRAVETGAAQALGQLETDGWQVRYDALGTRGFPSRFDTTVTGITLRDPGTGFGWTAPFLQVFALSYRPNKVIVVWPDNQTLTLPDQSVAITTTGLRASGSVALGSALTLNTITAETGAATLTSDAGWAMALDRGLFAMRPAGDDGQTYDIYLDGAGIVLPDAVRAQLDPSGALSPALDLVKLDSSVRFDKPLDRFAGAGAAPAPTQITLRDARLVWGGMVASGDGDLDIGPDGTPTGRIILRAQNWEAMIAVAQSAGLVDAGVAPTWVNMGRSLANGTDTIEMPLTFANGNMALGPFPLGPAPKLR